MKIIPLYLTPFMADGNEMFGDVPQSVWESHYEADKRDLCTWALRSLLIDDGENIVLIDTGFASFDKKNIELYYVQNFRSVGDVLNDAGYTAEQVTHVIHTHLHIDHCGGSFLKNSNAKLIPAFANAKYIVSEQQMHSALRPSDFEKESFSPHLVKTLSKCHNLQLVESDCFLFPWLELKLYFGHTHGLAIPIIHSSEQSIAFVGDLIPSAAHIQLQSSTNYDVDKELSFLEHAAFLEKAYIKNYTLFFQHDFYHECCTLKKENSRFMPAVFLKL